jgi:aminomethyltransferase
MTDEKLHRTPLYACHVAAGARIVPFAGFEMPVQYAGVVAEHQAVRSAVGLFDVSHMGEVELRGPRALEVADRIVTNDVGKASDGQAVYAAMCKPDGGIVDDLVVYRFSSERIFICVNASNRAKDVAWIRAQAGDDCEVLDRSDEFAQIAVQGPKAVELVARLTEVELEPIKTYRFATGLVAGVDTIISRTGYTGEDGFELYVPSADGAKVWDALLEHGAELGVQPAGLGARDSLRLEMKYALYGNDIDETSNPIEAGLGWIVKLDKGDFVGREALAKVKADGPSRKLIGFEMVDRGIARQHYDVVDEAGAKIGEVTSGTKGPSVDKAIGMAWVPTARSAVGTPLSISIRGKATAARVVKTPFLVRGGR